MTDDDSRGHCPKCGRFCGHVLGYINDIRGLYRVTGQCKTHGLVDLTAQPWSCDDFEDDDEAD